MQFLSSLIHRLISFSIDLNISRTRGEVFVFVQPKAESGPRVKSLLKLLL